MKKALFSLLALALSLTASATDISGQWYEQTTGMYYGSDWADFSLVNNSVTVTVDGTTATFNGLLGDGSTSVTATIDGTTLTFAKGQTIYYGGYDWELGAEDADGAQADLVGTISEDGSTITLDGLNIWYGGSSYMYNTKVTLGRDKAEEAAGETIDFGDMVVTNGEQAMTVVPCTDKSDLSHWYLLKQKRGGVSPCYDNGENKTLMRAVSSFAMADGSKAADYAQYLVRFIPTENEGAYNIQFGTGRYFGTTMVASNTPGEYNVYNINGEDGHIGINLYNMADIVDNNAAGNTLAFWSTGEVITLDGNNDWTIWDVNVKEASQDEKEQAARNEALEALIAESSTAYTAGEVYVKGEGLITSVDQLSSPYTETSEGALANLLDGNTSTFWHSAWSGGDVEAGIHYLEIALPENTIGDIELDLTRRPVTNDHLTKADIIGVNADGTTETVATIELPYGSNTETVTATFTLDKAYASIRILEQATSSSRGYWHASEIQLYSVSLDESCYNAQNPQAAAALAAALATAKTVENASQEDIDALQAAYDAYKAGDSKTTEFAISVDSYLGSYYEGLTVEAPLDDILAAIGATSMSEVTVYSETGDGARTASVRGTTDGWRDANGNFASWGSSTCMYYLQDNSELPGAEYYLGGYPDRTNDVVSYTSKLVYVNNTTSAEATLYVTLNYVEAPKSEVVLSDKVYSLTVNYSISDGAYTEQVISLTDDQIAEINSFLGLSSLSEGDVLGYNATTQELLTSYTAFDGWRDGNGDFHTWTGNSEAPICVKVYDDGANYYCYNLGDQEPATYHAYWVIANKTTGVLVDVTFEYSISTEEAKNALQASVDEANALWIESGDEIAELEASALGEKTAAGLALLTDENATAADMYYANEELQAAIEAAKATLNGGAVNGKTDGINGVEAGAQAKAIYNIAGQRVNKAQKGIFIINGKKVIK